MTRSMQALVKERDGFGGVVLREAPVPQAVNGRALLRVLSAGICATDLRLADGPALPWGPVILGHEIAGEIVEPGDSTYAVGKRVIGFPLVYRCGRCRACQRGDWNLCPHRRAAGVSADGGFADFIALPGESLRCLPAGLDPTLAPMCEPLACAVHAVTEIANVEPGERVVVVGAGTLGLLSMQVSLAQGANVAVLERLPGERAALAAELGANVVFTGLDTRAAALAWTEDDGAHVVIECSGTAAGAALGLALLGQAGRFVQLGTFGQPIALDLDELTRKEGRIFTAFATTPRSWNAAVALVETGQVKLKMLLSATLPLSAWADGFECVRKSRGIKTVLIPGLT